MKFLCIDCDQVMSFVERQIPGDGTLAAVFVCGKCEREMALLTNPMETQMVSSLGVKIGGREVPAQPLEGVRTSLSGAREEAFAAPEQPGGESEGSRGAPPSAGAASPPGSGGPPGVEWSRDAVDRLQRVPSFVRGMVKRIYTDYARERDIRTITPEVMDRARTELGLEGM